MHASSGSGLPEILSQFDFGSLTELKLRIIEKELTEVSLQIVKVLTNDLQATIAVYDALGALPLTSLSYSTVLKPLIDLDLESSTKNSWMDVRACITRCT
jgi:hypothetical protein